jgi:hypothetical protein
VRKTQPQQRYNVGMVLSFQAKHPGPKRHLRTVEVQLNYQDMFGAGRTKKGERS